MNIRGSIVLVTLLLGGCYTTKVYTGALPYGAELNHRQWYTIGGLVSLSDPAGLECAAGLAKTESEFGGLDILINVGLAVAGGIAGAVACGGGDEGAACGSAGATLVPFLIASRTVSYTCAAPPLAPGAWPPRPLQAPPAPYQPPPPTSPAPAPPAPFPQAPPPAKP